MEKKTKLIIKITCIILVCWLFYKIAIFCWFLSGSVQSDVVKRIQSPDRTKMALLVRRHALVDLNFLVQLEEDSSIKTLHFSKDFAADFSADWKEKLVWSNDSTFLVMMVDDINQNNQKYMWAYDFKDDKEYTDETEIMKILDSRNEGKENLPEMKYK